MIDSRFTSIVLSTLVLFLSIGCASKGTTGADTNNGTAFSGGGSSSSDMQAQALDSESNPNAHELSTVDSDDTVINANTIYFDYDSAELKPRDKAIVEKYAQQLLNDPSLKVRLEGHADERGSREYNMALGEKRAYAIEQLLELKGVGKQQIETVSFGEEKPEIEGHDELSWSKNRRAVFVYADN